MTLSTADRLALSDLVHRYAAGADDRHFDSVARLFTDNAELAVPDPPTVLEPVHVHRGQRAIAVAVASVGALERTEHAIVGEVYDQDAHSGIASGRIACVAHHWTRRDEQADDLVWHVRYRDEYRLMDAGWRIHRRALTVDAIETRAVRRVRPPDPA
ncbi:MAG: nuclear transport factor 2 family protein [Mycobacterium sp.]